MGKLRKLVFLVILIATAYFGLQYLGLIGGGQMQAIDSKYGLGEAKLVPGTMEELENYERELKAIDTSGDEQKVLSIKLELVEMQKSMLVFIENQGKIDLEVPDCRVAGPVVSARKAAEDALEHTNNVIGKKNALPKNLDGFDYLTKSNFRETLNAVKTSMQESINTLKTIC